MSDQTSYLGYNPDRNIVQTIIVYTGAPEAADYSQSTTVEVFEAAACPGAPMKTWRKVAITEQFYRIAYQCDRYWSFLGGCPTLDDPREFPIGTGRHAPSNSK